ncbi:cobyrinate a,c-diamide synthase [Synechococcus sp. CCY 9618]|uniref:cobyrinate a,c-diamide synthase n=1 Tax=Synechococcus sp. CCY 9618 TaxID=2815602 RepID=UPI001C22E454|nr:cobyrinate a,c-diamide synthase [Synechococcus sp. CCY 9618]
MSCLIAAPCSGSGKTLLSLCLAAVARARGKTIQPFKVGPDYLDPQLLGAVAGRPCRNLDPLLCGEEWVRRSYRWHGGRADRVLVEGVMGLFDGRGAGSEGSSAAVADLLELPVVLVVEASRQAGSLAALVRGFRDHGPPRVRLAGVVLNRVGSERHHRLLAEALEAIAMPLLGVLPSHPSLELPSRHLGLLPPGELGDLGDRQRIWAQLAEEHLDLERLWPLLAPPDGPPERQDPIRWCLQQGPDAPPAAASADPLPVAIASDAAFHFRYPEAQELLEACGLRPLAWSPLADEPLPLGCRAVVLPGGYPELHAEQLAASRRSLGSLGAAARAGRPIAAECGGLLLLGQELEDGEGIGHPMAGLLPFSARRGPLCLGYRTAVPRADGLLVRRGEPLCGHEFHRWQLVPRPNHGGELAGVEALWQLEGWGFPPRIEGWTAPNVHASWLHLHWAGCPAIPSRLARAVASAGPPQMNAVSCDPTSAPRPRPMSAGG